VIGGIPFTQGPIAHILKNRTYIGDLNHRQNAYPADHAPIVSRELFDAVQKQLEANRNARAQKHQASGALLIGKLFDQYGRPMTPTYACKGARRYRYYVSRLGSADPGKLKQPIVRVRAEDIDHAVVNALKAEKQHPTKDPESDEERIAKSLTAATLHESIVELRLTAETALIAGNKKVSFTWEPPRARMRREVLARSANEEPQNAIRLDAKTRASLVRAIARGRAWLQEIVSCKEVDAEAIATREKVTGRYVRIMLSFAFLSPDVVLAAAEAKLPSIVGQRLLAAVPMLWSDQRCIFHNGLREEQKAKERMLQGSGA
jgi:hypothetical protein